MKKQMFNLIIILILTLYIAVPNIAVASELNESQKYGNILNNQDDEQDDDNGQYDCE